MVQNAIQTRTLTEAEQALIGKLLYEALTGEIQPETWDAIYGLGDLRTLPEPYGHLVAFAQGYALDAKSLAIALQEEIRNFTIEKLDQVREHPNATSTAWIGMYGILDAILTGDKEGYLRDNLDMYMPSVAQVPEWAIPIIQYVKATRNTGRELELALLDVLEAQIQKRRAELTK